MIYVSLNTGIWLLKIKKTMEKVGYKYLLPLDKRNNFENLYEQSLCQSMSRTQYMGQ